MLDLKTASSSRLHGGVRGGAQEDAALAASLNASASLEQDVALVTPRGAPRVLHLVVVVAGAVSAVAHGQHTVVQRSAAGSGHHTAGVELEGRLVGLHGHRHGLLGDGGHQGGLIVGRHILVAGDGGHGSAGLAARC